MPSRLLPHTIFRWERNKHWLNNSRLLDLAVGGWTVSSILRIYSGTPFYFRSGNCNVPGQFDVNCLPGVLSGADPFAQSKSNFDVNKPLFDISAFEPADAFNYYFGSGSRITNLRGFGYRNQDLMLSKAFALTERISLQIRGEAFNLWNYHVFRGFTTDIASPNFGLWDGTVTAPRNVQLGARLQF
jgi:trimeric autotransporter adhesin